MYHITAVRDEPEILYRNGWYKGDHVLFARGGMCFPVESYPIAFDVQPIDDPERSGLTYYTFTDEFADLDSIPDDE